MRKMDRDEIIWELNQWFVPVWQEHISWRFMLLYFVVTNVLLLLTWNQWIVLGWAVGFPIFGIILAAYWGMFECG